MKTKDIEPKLEGFPRSPIPLGWITQDRYLKDEIPPLPDLPDPRPLVDIPPHEVLFPGIPQGKLGIQGEGNVLHSTSWNIPAPVCAPSAPSRRRIVRDGTFETLRGFRAKLTISQEDRLLHWLADHTLENVRKLVQAPPPTGFGLEVSIPTLSRMRHDLEGMRLARNFEETAEVIASLNHHADTSELARTQEATIAMLSDVAFRIAHLEPGLPDLARVVDAISKLSSIVAARERLALEKAKLAQRDAPQPPPQAPAPETPPAS